MAQKCSGQNFMSFVTKTFQIYKPTQNDLVLSPKRPNILFFVALWLFDTKDDQENFRSKFRNSFKNGNYQSWQSWKL